jgi:hypothetical protein
LARLNQMSGVAGSFTNASGTLIRLSLQPGADPGHVAALASRVLREQTRDHVGVRLGGGTAATALQTEDWRDAGRVAEGLAAGTRTDPTRADPTRADPTRTDPTQAVEARPSERHGLLAVLLGCVAVGLWLLWRRHRQARTAGQTSRPRSPLLRQTDQKRGYSRFQAEQGAADRRRK